MTAAERLDPAWLVAAVPRGIVCARAGTEIALEVPAPFPSLVRLVRGLAQRPDPAAVAEAAGTTVGEAGRAFDVLREHGVLTREPPRPAPVEGLPLAEAVLRVSEGAPVELAWTATEALVVPPGVGAVVARRAVRWFLAALHPDARADAYAAVAANRQPGVAGDVPEATALAGAVARARAADSAAVHVAEVDGLGLSSLPPEQVGRTGFDDVHRLGPLQHLVEVATGPPLRGRRASFAAEYAIANLAAPARRAVRVGRGTASDPAAARLVARAEAAERFAAGDVDPSRLRRATRDELDDAVAPDALHRLSARQYAAHPDVEAWTPEHRLLWIRGRRPGGHQTWVPAEAVHLGLPDPGARSVVHVSSSGLAAGTSARDAADRALRELMERDAFLWTWVHGVSRERLDPAGLPKPGLELARAVEATGFEVALVNLSLEPTPVVGAVLHREDRIHVAAACRDDPVQAASKALDEAALALSLELDRPAPGLVPEDVVTPEDHMRLFFRAERVVQARFLFASPEVADLRDVPPAPAPPLEVARTIGEPVLVDLTTPRTAPFHVVRALVPGIVPMSFGWNREPLGMERLRRPRRLPDGRLLGAEIDAEGVGSILPHPFP